jgi:hypothetical protein
MEDLLEESNLLIPFGDLISVYAMPQGVVMGEAGL